MTVKNLPSSNSIRWTIWRKIEVVAAVHNGVIGLDEACQRYRMSVEEFRNWEQLIDEPGFQGSQIIQLQDYRQPFRGTGKSEK